MYIYVYLYRWATYTIPNWTFVEGLYFAVSSCSTGGLWAIPSDSPDSYFAIAGAFSCLGVPLMAVAITSLIGLIFDIGRVRCVYMYIHVNTLIYVEEDEYVYISDIYSIY